MAGEARLPPECEAAEILRRLVRTEARDGPTFRATLMAARIFLLMEQVRPHSHKPPPIRLHQTAQRRRRGFSPMVDGIDYDSSDQ